MCVWVYVYAFLLSLSISLSLCLSLFLSPLPPPAPIQPPQPTHAHTHCRGDFPRFSAGLLVSDNFSTTLFYLQQLSWNDAMSICFLIQLGTICPLWYKVRFTEGFTISAWNPVGHSSEEWFFFPWCTPPTVMNVSLRSEPTVTCASPGPLHRVRIIFTTFGSGHRLALWLFLYILWLNVMLVFLAY